MMTMLVMSLWWLLVRIHDLHSEDIMLVLVRRPVGRWNDLGPFWLMFLRHLVRLEFPV